MKRLFEIQQELKVPKDQKGYGYKYRSAEQILELLKPLLAKRDLIINLSDELIEMGTIEEDYQITDQILNDKKDKVVMHDIHSRVFIKSTATLFGVDGNLIKSSVGFAELDTSKNMDKSQITGSASSYARKYALNGLFGIDNTKDADSREYQDAGIPAPSISSLKAQIKTLGWEEKESEILASYKVKTFEDLSPKQRTNLGNGMAQEIKKLQKGEK